MRLFYYTTTNSFFSLVSSQQFLTKLCLTPLVFFSGLLEICKIDDIQWHFYEHVTKFYLWAANWPYSQRRSESNFVLIPDSPSLFWKFYSFMETFSRKKTSERMLYHVRNRDLRLLYSYPRISNIFCKINYDGTFFTAHFSQSISGQLLLLNILLFAESTSAPKCYYRPDFFLISFKHFQN